MQDVVLKILKSIGQSEKSKEDIADLLSIKDVRYIAGAVDVLVELGLLKRNLKGPAQLHCLSEKSFKLAQTKSTILLQDSILVKKGSA